ncbi:hypothetical protein [Nitrospira sp. KM1]|uniref:glycoside hydrolase domain-containing protein n=1 Tax=Nitrospira sp. KM1 TaxID=1936990 RepID=UPI00156500D4|nr:hypothetical protein [Nitrospira sp. KM1]
MNAMNNRASTVKTSSQILGIIVMGASIALSMNMPGYAEVPNLGPLFVHVVDPISPGQILPGTYPLPGSASTMAQVSACRDEYEPVSFVIRSSGRDITNLRFDPSDLVGDSGSIPKSSIDLRLVKVWYQAGGGWNTIGLSYMGKSKVLVPELLLKDDELIKADEASKSNFVRLKFPSGNKLVSVTEPAALRVRVQTPADEFPVSDAKELQPISLRKNETRQLWVTVHVPHDAKSGIYRGRIAVMDDTGLIGNLGVTLEVLPFNLDPPKIDYSIYYRGTLSESSTISSERKSHTQFVAELTNMLAHGVKNPTVYHRLNKAELNETLRIRREVGLDSSTLYYLGSGTGNPDTAEQLIMLNRRLKAMKDIVGEQGIKTIYLYGIDEAKGERLASQRKAWEAVRDEGVKVFTAGSSDAFSLTGDLLDLLVLAGKLQPVQAEQFHGAGHRIFSYANPQTGPENPEVFRRNYGLELWRNDYDGAMPYAYQDSMGFIWNDFDHPQYRDHNFTYPTVDGVIDTLAWEGFREGIDDVRYVTTLENALEHSSKPYPAAALEAKKFLTDLRASLPAHLAEVRSKTIYHLLRVVSENN